MTYQGVWDANTSYLAGDTVTYQGDLYTCTSDVTPDPLLAQVAYVSGGSQSGIQTFSYSGLQAGDVLVLMITKLLTSGSGDTGINVPSGWTVVQHVVDPVNNGLALTVATFVVPSTPTSDPTTYTIPAQTNSPVSGVVYAYLALRNVTPLLGHGSSGTSLSTYTPTAGATSVLVVPAVSSESGPMNRLYFDLNPMVDSPVYNIVNTSRGAAGSWGSGTVGILVGYYSLPVVSGSVASESFVYTGDPVGPAKSQKFIYLEMSGDPITFPTGSFAIQGGKPRTVGQHLRSVGNVPVKTFIDGQWRLIQG